MDKTKTVELSEAQGQLPALVAQAAAGTEIVLVEGNMPRARLVALAPLGSQRVAGLHPGSMEAAADFDAPLLEEIWVGRREASPRARITYWKEPDGRYLGYLNAYPDHWTQGDDLADLREHLRDLFQSLSVEEIPGIRKEEDLEVAQSAATW